MHMADALLSPAVGGCMWLVSAGTIVYCSRRVRRELDERRVPLMGVLGAFLFAAQMINFSIPATGSSGHLGGGLLLTILLGADAAFLTMASVLVVQALFFADGGLLALGCNLFNMGFIPAFIVYPFIYRKLEGDDPNRKRMVAATILSALAGLQLGPFAVVLETWLSGISALPFSAFLLLMQPIHLAIGVVEGVVTIALLRFVHQARPEILARPRGDAPGNALLVAFLAAAIFTGGALPWFASRHPDGLEWAIAHATGEEKLKDSKRGIHQTLAALQTRTSFMPEYAFRSPPKRVSDNRQSAGPEEKSAGTGTAGVIGVLLTLGAILGSGVILKKLTHPALR